MPPKPTIDPIISEHILMQVQCAVAPLTLVVNELRKEIRAKEIGRDEVLRTELAGFRELMVERTGNIMSELAEVKTQTLKTNGRVNALELAGAKADGKAAITVVIWAFIVSIAISVVSFFINKNI